MKKKNKGEPPLRLAIVWILLIFSIYGLSEYKHTQAISPVPDDFSFTVDSEHHPVLPQDGGNGEIEETIDELITFYCEKYEVREDLVRCVIANESSFNHLAIGDSGKAVGLSQFWLGTWRAFRKLMGLDDSDMRTDKAESIKTLVWGLANGKGSHWTPIKRGVCQ